MAYFAAPLIHAVFELTRMPLVARTVEPFFSRGWGFGQGGMVGQEKACSDRPPRDKMSVPTFPIRNAWFAANGDGYTSRDGAKWGVGDAHASPGRPLAKPDGGRQSGSPEVQMVSK